MPCAALSCQAPPQASTCSPGQQRWRLERTSTTSLPDSLTFSRTSCTPVKLINWQHRQASPQAAHRRWQAPCHPRRRRRRWAPAGRQGERCEQGGPGQLAGEGRSRMRRGPRCASQWGCCWWAAAPEAPQLGALGSAGGTQVPQPERLRTVAHWLSLLSFLSLICCLERSGSLTCRASAYVRLAGWCGSGTDQASRRRRRLELAGSRKASPNSC